MATSGENLGHPLSDPALGRVTTGGKVEQDPHFQPRLSTATPSKDQPIKDLESQREPHETNHLLRSRLTSEITTTWADTVLIACFFTSGLTDSSAFTVYGCFMGMQTGNSVFVGLGPSGLPADGPPHVWARALMAVGSFLCGALFFATFHRYFGPLKRWVLIGSFLIQALLIAIPAALITGDVFAKTAEEVDRNWINLIPIAMLGFQSAGQVVASRVLKYTLPTVVLTSLYCDLMSDPDLFTAGLFRNANRNRRVVSIIALLVGAIVGGFVVKSSIGIEGALFIACGLKLAMALSWLFWKKQIPSEKAK